MKNVNTQHRISIGLQIGVILLLILSQIIYAYRFSLLPPIDTLRDGGSSPMRLVVYFVIAIPTVFSLIRAFRGQGLILSIVPLIPSTFLVREYVFLYIENLYLSGWDSMLQREPLGIGSLQDTLVYALVFILLLAAAILNFLGWLKNRKNVQSIASDNEIKR